MTLVHSLAVRVVVIMDKSPPPSELQLTGNVSDNWAKFRQKFDLYLEATSSAGKATELYIDQWVKQRERRRQFCFMS